MVQVTWPRWPPCPYMVKIFKNFLLQNQKSYDLETWHVALRTQALQSYINDDPGLTLTYFTARPNLVPYAFVWEKGKTMDFLETIVVYDLKLATDDRSDKKFLLTSKLCPLGAVCPLPWGYIHVLNHEKMYKIRQSDNAFLLTSKFCPLGVVCPCPGAIYMY